MKTMRSLYFCRATTIAKFILINFVTLILICATSLIEYFHSHLIDLSSTYTVNIKFQQQLINQRLLTYSYRYNNSSNICNATYILNSNQKQEFDSVAIQLRDLRKQMIPYPTEYFQGRGIVLTAGSKQLQLLKVNLKMLETTGTKLPVQVSFLIDHLIDRINIRITNRL